MSLINSCCYCYNIFVIITTWYLNSKWYFQSCAHLVKYGTIFFALPPNSSVSKTVFEGKLRQTFKTRWSVETMYVTAGRLPLHTKKGRLPQAYNLETKLSCVTKNQESNPYFESCICYKKEQLKMENEKDLKYMKQKLNLLVLLVCTS